MIKIFWRKTGRPLGWSVFLFLAGLWVWADFAEARAGRGGSFGSRGSRSFSSPERPSSSMPGRTDAPSSFAQPRPGDSSARNMPYQQPPSAFGGGLMRGLGAGLLGGFLGSMLFSSFSHAGIGAGAAGGGWGGPGLFDLLLLGGIGYLAYRWFSQRQAQSGNAQRASWSPTPAPRYEQPLSLPANEINSVDRGLEQLRVLDPAFDARRFCDAAMDFFFRLQAAWDSRNLGTVSSQITEGLTADLQNDLTQLQRQQIVNHVENIAVRTCEITEAWQETGQDFVTVYFYANCLDYDLKETTGEVVRGSKVEPSKFEEFWTFTRPAGNGQWKLSAITQA